MRLAGVRPGDIVQVDIKGRKFHAEVRGYDSGISSLRIQPLDERISYYSATSRQVVGLWRRAGRRNGA